MKFLVLLCMLFAVSGCGSADRSKMSAGQRSSSGFTGPDPTPRIPVPGPSPSPNPTFFSETLSISVPGFDQPLTGKLVNTGNFTIETFPLKGSFTLKRPVFIASERKQDSADEAFCKQARDLYLDSKTTAAQVLEFENSHHLYFDQTIAPLFDVEWLAAEVGKAHLKVAATNSKLPPIVIQNPITVEGYKMDVSAGPNDSILGFLGLPPKFPSEVRGRNEPGKPYRRGLMKGPMLSIVEYCDLFQDHAKLEFREYASINLPSVPSWPPIEFTIEMAGVEK
jgi:hypothetical protein